MALVECYQLSFTFAVALDKLSSWQMGLFGVWQLGNFGVSKLRIVCFSENSSLMSHEYS